MTNWDHQHKDVLIVDVEPGWLDYTVVEIAFFDWPRPDGKTLLISAHGGQGAASQEPWAPGSFQGKRKHMVQKQGEDKVEMTCDYTWHAAFNTWPDDIVAGEGLMTQYGNAKGFYQQGN